MNRINRRTARKEAMMNTLVRLTTAIRQVRISDPDGKATFKKLSAQKEYLARQIAEASYTQHTMKGNQAEVERILTSVRESNCSEWVEWDIKRLAASRRRWAIATAKEIWLG